MDFLETSFQIAPGKSKANFFRSSLPGELAENDILLYDWRLRKPSLEDLMSYEITVNREFEMIEIHVMGETNPLEALEARNRSALIASELGFRKVVVYGARIERVQGFSPAMLLNFATSFREKPFPVDTKFAVIPAQISDRLSSLARLARESGTRMQLFNDDSLAIDWLSGVLATTELEPI